MSSKYFGISFLCICISLFPYSWGMLYDEGVELCYSFRPDAPGMEDMSIKMNSSYFFTLSATKMVSEFKTYRYAQVTLKAVRDERPFQGFILRAVSLPMPKNPQNLEPQPIGAFHPAPESNLISCFRGLNNVIIHHDEGYKSEAVVEWSPPVYRGKTPGRVAFIATVIENEKKYWYGVASHPVAI